MRLEFGKMPVMSSDCQSGSVISKVGWGFCHIGLMMNGGERKLHGIHKGPMNDELWTLSFFFFFNKGEVLPDECQLRCEVSVEGPSLWPHRSRKRLQQVGRERRQPFNIWSLWKESNLLVYLRFSTNCRYTFLQLSCGKETFAYVFMLT